MSLRTLASLRNKRRGAHDTTSNGDDAVRYVSSARDVEAVLEDVGEVVPPPAPVEE